MTRTIAAFVCILALAGCNAFPIPGSGSSSAASAQESRQVTELIGYTQKVAALRAEDQRRELSASNQVFSKDRGAAYGRVRLALLLALPGTAFNDDARAASLLEPLAGDLERGLMQQFAGLLHTQISERVREQRRSREQLEAMKAIERNAAQLKEQLDAMKAIERKIIERELARPR
jgi:hypothetical protein